MALSGVEAISNGIQAFEPPETRNAATTLTWTGILLGALFFGEAVLASHLRPTLSQDQTIMSIMGRAVFGSGVAYWLLQAATAAILVLSANTAFAAFPRLASVIAQDGYLPRQLASRGDRLVFSNGIIALTLAAVALLVAFRGITTLLVPLFAVGLFASFTLSQAGMVMHHLRLREPGWRRGIAINGLGTAATATVLVVVVASKFTEGAWIPTLVIPAIVVVFRAIHRHYADLERAIALKPGTQAVALRHTVVVLVGRPHRGLPVALAYAKSLHPEHLVAVSVATDDVDPDEVRAQWDAARVRRAAGDRGVPVPRPDRTDPRVPRRAGRPVGRRHGHGGDPRDRGPPLVRLPAAQPERAHAEGPAALPGQHGRDVGALALGPERQPPRARPGEPGVAGAGNIEASEPDG